jgi:hypothetical protein
VKREQLEHVLGAASQIADDPDVLVIGSQSVLGAIPEERLPPAATASIEADVAFFYDPGDRKADEKDYVFAAALIRSRLIDPSVVAERIETVDVLPAVRQRLRSWIASHG